MPKPYRPFCRKWKENIRFVTEDLYVFISPHSIIHRRNSTTQIKPRIYLNTCVSLYCACCPENLTNFIRSRFTVMKANVGNADGRSAPSRQWVKRRRDLGLPCVVQQQANRQLVDTARWYGLWRLTQASCGVRRRVSGRPPRTLRRQLQDSC